jgi:hypothetical protein
VNRKYTTRAILGLLALAGSAWANSITESCTGIGPTATDVTNDDIGCATFNSTLGTLTSVSITVSGSETGTIVLTNDNTTTNNSESGEFLSSASIGSGLAGFTFSSPLFNFILISPTATDAAPTSVVTFSGLTTPTGTGSNGPVVDTTVFGTYESASPSTFNIPITTATSLGVFVDPTANEDLTSSAGSSDLLSANASVTFNFTPTTTTPEPLTSALVGSGLLLVGLIARRGGRGSSASRRLSSARQAGSSPLAFRFSLPLAEPKTGGELTSN